VRNALGSSLNVPAVKALEYAGLQPVYNLSKRMGLSTLEDISHYGAAFTLGGVDVSLLDMAYAFSVFANQGEQAGMSSLLGLPEGNRALDPVAVLKVQTAGGKTLWENRGRKERIVPANAAYLITHVLSDDAARVSMFGANSTLNLAGTAVKSGLSDNARDAWTIGYSPNVVTGVWVGNANNRPMPGATSSYAAAPIWRQYMQSAMQRHPSSGFPVPNDVQFVSVCAETGLLPGRTCRSTVTEVFLPGRAQTTSGESILTSPRLTQEPTRTPTNPSQQRRLVTPTPDADEDRSPSRRPRASPTPRPTEPLEEPVNPRRRDRGRD
jgi:membrane peptidoglycan carboxypeptidase